MSSPRHRHAVAVLDDGRVMIAGGFNGSAVLDSFELFDPAAEAFYPAGKMSTPRQTIR
jgi:hypothetical protein